MTLEAIQTREHSYRMPYSVGMRVPPGKELIYIAGTTALPLYHDHPHILEDLEFPSDPAEQTRTVLENIREVLEGADATLEDVVRLDIFVADMGVQNQVARTIGEFFPGPRPPAMSLIGVDSLVVPGLVVEINGIAAIDPR